MLSEEALVLIVVAVAVAVLALGVLELVWPSQPRYPRRRSASGRDPWRRARTSGAPPGRGRVPERTEERPPARAAREAPAPARAPRPPAEPDREPPIERLLRSQAASGPARVAWPPPRPLERTAPKPLDRVGPPDSAREPAAREPAAPPARPAALVAAPAVGAALVAAPAAAAPPAAERPGQPRAAESPPPRPPSPVEHCWALYEARQFTDAVREGTAVLHRVAAGNYALSDEDHARLLGVVGLARQAMGDHDAARAAFEQAIVVAPHPARLTWQRHLAGLALQAGQQLLARAENGAPADSEEGLSLARAAVVWFDAGLEAVPADAALQEARAAARSMLWGAHERVVAGLIQRQEYQAARRLVRQALSDAGCPPALQAAFRDLLATTFSGEVGQLTAEAIRRMQDGREDEALATLERAESILATIPPDGVADARRRELEQRLWWSYTKLGIRRVESGHAEAALGPLLHALSFASVAGDRQEETRAPLLRALQRSVDAGSPLIERMAADGDREGARALCERLRRSLREAIERGLPREQLGAALAKMDALHERLTDGAR